MLLLCLVLGTVGLLLIAIGLFKAFNSPFINPLKKFDDNRPMEEQRVIWLPWIGIGAGIMLISMIIRVCLG